MAKIAAHGKEIGTVYFTTSAKRYMSDGKVLKNCGFGWKLGPKLKDGVSVEQAYENQRQKQADFLKSHPQTAAYRKALHAETGLCKRWKLDLAISMMPDDPDGVWSECCDGYGDNVHADLDDIVELCMLYKNAIAEGKELVAA
jgi:hypothetical protein